MEELIQSEEWGDPLGYSITVNRKGVLVMIGMLFVGPIAVIAVLIGGGWGNRCSTRRNPSYVASSVYRHAIFSIPAAPPDTSKSYVSSPPTFGFRVSRNRLAAASISREVPLSSYNSIRVV
jgi:hypothetical protein